MWSTALVQGDGAYLLHPGRRGPERESRWALHGFLLRSAGREDYHLYSASRTDPTASPGEMSRHLSGINSGMADADPALFHDSLSLIWSSRAPSNGKSWDLVEVSRPDPSTPFSATPIPLDSLNTGVCGALSLGVSGRHPYSLQQGGCRRARLSSMKHGGEVHPALDRLTTSYLSELQLGMAFAESTVRIAVPPRRAPRPRGTRPT